MSKIRVDEIVDELGTGKPDFPNGFQVNGTSIVDENRQLTNIASLDATTVAAFSAAGVGGSNPTYTANEAINKGQPFSVLADLTASLTVKPEVIGSETFSSTGVYMSAGSYGGMKFFRDLNILALFGRTTGGAGSPNLALLKIVDEDNIIVGNTVSFSAYTSSVWQAGMDVALDGEGNGVLHFGMYRGSGGTHYNDLFTFAYDTTTMALSSVSGANRWGGDDYRFNCKMAAYDTNKFLCIRPNDQNSSGGFKYRTVSRSGSSLSLISSGSLGSSSGLTGLTGAFGHTSPSVPTGRVLIAGGENNNPSWNSGLTGYRNFASVLSVNSSGVPSIESVVTSSTDAKSVSGSHNFYTFEADQGVSTNGNFLAGRRLDNTYSTLSMFKKASESSDTLTEVKATLPNSVFKGAIDLEEEVYYTTSGLNSLQVKDFDDTLLSSSVMTNNTGNSFYFDFNNYFYRPAGIVAGTNIYDIPTDAQSVTNFLTTGTAGNTNKIIGIANNTVSSGEEVELALPSSVVDGFSGLSVGQEIGVGDTSGTTAVGGVPKLGVAISDTEVLIDTVIP